MKVQSHPCTWPKGHTHLWRHFVGLSIYKFWRIVVSPWWHSDGKTSSLKPYNSGFVCYIRFTSDWNNLWEYAKIFFQLQVWKRNEIMLLSNICLVSIWNFSEFLWPWSRFIATSIFHILSWWLAPKKISKIRTSWSGLANSEISVPQFMPFDAIKSEDAYFAICDKVLSLVVAIYLLYNRTKPLFYFMIGLFKV